MRCVPGEPKINISGPLRTAGMSQEDFGHDIVSNLVDDRRPGPRAENVGSSRLERLEASRFMRFWRRFDKSAMRQFIREAEDDMDKIRAFLKFLQPFDGRLPSKEELEAIEKLVKELGVDHGNDMKAEFIRQVSEVGKWMTKVPREDLSELLGQLPKLVGTDETDEPSDTFTDRKAKPFEVPLEFWQPEELVIDKQIRDALTQKQWLAYKMEEQKARIEFLVDSSGSMRECHSFAIACALVLAELAEAKGHQVFIRFIGNRRTERVPAKDWAKVVIQSGHLGSGDDFGKETEAIEKEPDPPTDIVVVSDYAISIDKRNSYPFVETRKGLRWEGPFYKPKARLHGIHICAENTEKWRDANPWWQLCKWRRSWTPIWKAG